MLVAAPLAAHARSGSPVVAVAASFQFAAEEIADDFAAASGDEVRLAYGSSGNFARQIRAGAPFELFLSADEQLVLDLDRDGFTRDEGRVYAVGRIVIAVPEGSPLDADGTLADLRAALEEGRLTRFAIASPEHAPYGMRAVEVLQHAGLWEPIQPYLVIGENVAQAAQFALSGNADGGLIAYSLAVSPNVAGRGRYALISDAWHVPLRQRMVLLDGAGPIAEAFHAYLTSVEARATMERHGFTAPVD